MSHIRGVSAASLVPLIMFPLFLDQANRLVNPDLRPRLSVPLLPGDLEVVDLARCKAESAAVREELGEMPEVEEAHRLSYRYPW